MRYRTMEYALAVAAVALTLVAAFAFASPVLPGLVL